MLSHEEELKLSESTTPYLTRSAWPKDTHAEKLKAKIDMTNKLNPDMTFQEDSTFHSQHGLVTSYMSNFQCPSVMHLRIIAFTLFWLMPWSSICCSLSQLPPTSLPDFRFQNSAFRFQIFRFQNQFSDLIFQISDFIFQNHILYMSRFQIYQAANANV